MTSYYHYDGQLSTRQLSDASQNITDTYTYDAFGLLLNRTGATENNYLYTGEQYDPNCGFYYLRARYYNASVGRFLTRDTWKGSLYEPLSLHKYLYCEGDPVNKIDYNGCLSTAFEATLSSIICAIMITSLFSTLALNYSINNRSIEQFDYGTDRFRFSMGFGGWVAVGITIGRFEMIIEELPPSKNYAMGKKALFKQATYNLFLIGGLGLGASLTGMTFNISSTFKTNNLRRLEDFVGWGQMIFLGVSIFKGVSLSLSQIIFPDGTYYPEYGKLSPGGELSVWNCNKKIDTELRSCNLS